MNGRIHLFRHGETEWNLLEQIQGHGDSPLTEAGRNQAIEASKLLKGENVSTVVCSSSGRALETAEIMTASMNDVSIVPEDDLREINFGLWEGRKKLDVEREYAREYKRFWHQPECYEPVGGETFQRLWQRSIGAFERIIEAHTGETIVIISHATPVKAIMSHCVGRPISEIWEAPFAGNLSHSVVDIGESGERRVSKFCDERWQN